MGAYEDAAEARMAAAKKAREAASASGDDEQTRKAAAEEARLAAEEAGIPSVSPKRIKDMTPEELDAFQEARLSKEKKTRETGGGTNPPYEAPEGTKWSFIGGEWKLYKLSDTGPGPGPKPGPGPGPGPSTTAATSTTTYTATDGKIFTDLDAYNAYNEKLKAEEKARAGKSAYDILYNEFNKYGMGSLIEPLKKFIQDGLSREELTLKLRETPQYQDRFRANEFRIKNGFAAIDEATYLGLEDKYQSIMMNYGLPASYYERGALGKQVGFEKLIGGNVDPITLEERIMEGQKVVKGNKDIKDAIGQFYPGISNGDFLAYVLDPDNALAEIKRKVTAAEIGGSAIGAGLTTNVTRAEELGTAGITRVQAQEGYGAIGGGLQRGSQLASIYGEDPYTQTTAEEEVFRLSGRSKAKEKREKITGLEKASFAGKTGLSSGALSRDRAGAN